MIRPDRFSVYKAVSKIIGKTKQGLNLSGLAASL